MVRIGGFLNDWVRKLPSSRPRNHSVGAACHGGFQSINFGALRMAGSRGAHCVVGFANIHQIHRGAFSAAQPAEHAVPFKAKHVGGEEISPEKSAIYPSLHLNYKTYLTRFQDGTYQFVSEGSPVGLQQNT